MTISGLHIQYYHVCKRKLWLHSKHLNMELEHDRIQEGIALHNRAYRHLDDKEVMFDNELRVDAIDGDYVREVKISSRMEEADRWQLLFYLYQLRIRGIYKKGLLSYTKEKKTEEVELTPEREKQLRKILGDIARIIAEDKPPKLKKLAYCKKCAYYDFCFAGEKEDND